jgi:hypothetical protein
MVGKGTFYGMVKATPDYLGQKLGAHACAWLYLTSNTNTTKRAITASGCLDEYGNIEPIGSLSRKIRAAKAEGLNTF